MNGNILHWYLGSHAIRANFDRSSVQMDTRSRIFLEPGVAQDLFRGVRLFGELRNPQVIRRATSVALGLYLKHQKFFAAKAVKGKNWGLTLGAGEQSGIPIPH